MSFLKYSYELLIYIYENELLKERCDLREASPSASRHALVTVRRHSAQFWTTRQTVDSLLGSGEVNCLDTAGLLELGGNSSLGGSCDASSCSIEG